VVKHVDEAELRVAVAVVLPFAADAVLVAHHLPKPGSHQVMHWLSCTCTNSRE
jgi:membrane protein YqaA with SNARE-associated domain